MIWPSHYLNALPGQGYRLCLAIRLGCRLGSMAWWYIELGSEAAQGHCSGSLVIWGQRLHLTVGQGCRMGSMVAQVPPARLPGVMGLEAVLCIWWGCGFVSLLQQGNRTGCITTMLSDTHEESSFILLYVDIQCPSTICLKDLI